MDAARQREWAVKSGQALSLHFGGELAPCVLAENQNRSQRVLGVTHRDRLAGVGEKPVAKKRHRIQARATSSKTIVASATASAAR